MQIRRFFSPELRVEDTEAVLSEGEAQHALRVLRLEPGDRLQLLNGRGLLAEAELLADASGARHPKTAHCRILSSRTQLRPAGELMLCVAPPRGKAFDLVLRAATELGIAVIQPILCQYGVARPEEPSENWRETLITALKQSINPWLPELREPREFTAVLEASRGQPGIFGATPDRANAAPAIHSAANAAILWIGPEGGFTTSEEQSLQENGMTPITLGACVLRVETAVPALVGYLYGLRAKT